MATIVEELLVSLGVKPDTAALDKWDKRTDESAKKSDRNFKQMAASAGKSFAKVGAVAAAAGVAVFALVSKSAALGDQAAKDAKKLGVTAEAIQELDFAAKLSGTNVETMKVGIQALGRGLNDARTKGVGPAAEAFEQLGISLDSAAVQSGDLEQVLPLVADKIAALPDGLDKTALSMKLFSRSGAELIPLLNGGSEGLAKMRAEARATGSVISNEAAAKMEEFNDDMLRLKKELQGVGLELAQELLPLMHDMIPVVRDVGSAVGDFTRGIVEVTEKIGTPSAGMVGGLGLMAVALGGLPGLFAAVAAAGVLAGSQIAAAFADAERQIDHLEAKRKRAADDTDRIKAGRGAVKELTDRLLEGTLDEMGSAEFEKLVDDAIRVGASDELINTIDESRAGDLARKRRQAEDAAVFDPTEGLLTERERRIVQSTGRLPGQKGGRSGGGGLDSATRQGLVQVSATGLEGELRDLGEQVGATTKAIEASLRAAAQQFAAGASQQVARQSGMSTLSGLTGVDVSKRQNDPLLSAIFGDGSLPDAPISEVAQGMSPQVLISTINNNFDIEISNLIDGAGNSPADIGSAVVDRFRDLFENEVQAASKLSKVNFAR